MYRFSMLLSQKQIDTVDTGFYYERLQCLQRRKLYGQS